MKFERMGLRCVAHGTRYAKAQACDRGALRVELEAMMMGFRDDAVDADRDRKIRLLLYYPSRLVQTGLSIKAPRS